MADKKTVVVLSVIAGVIAVLVIAFSLIMNAADGKIEEEISAQIDSAIEREGLGQNFSYGVVQSNAARGRITLTDVRFSSPDGDGDMQADNIRISIPVKEAVGIIQDPRGASISKLELRGEKLAFSNPRTGNKTETGALLFYIEGVLDQSLMEASLPELIEKISSVQISLDNSKFTPGPEFLTQMQMFPGAATLVSDGAFDVKMMNIDADVSPKKMTMKTLNIDSGLMSFDGSADIDFDEAARPGEFAGELTINRLHNDMRRSMEPFFQQIGQPLPAEGSFDLGLHLPEDGSPEITVK